MLKLKLFKNPNAMAQSAARYASGLIEEAIEQRGTATVVLATGASQLKFLETLVREPVRWNQVTFFHLDEYIELPESHPASICRYLKERVCSKIEVREFHFVNGVSSDPEAERRRLSRLISGYSIDLACVGIGENGHLAFNDPPADFHTKEPFLIVELDEACRRQQLGEGWFNSLEEVPRKAISMSIQQILSSSSILCVVPDKRKAPAVKACLEGEMSSYCPASILREHADTMLMVDEASASELSESALDRYRIGV